MVGARQARRQCETQGGRTRRVERQIRPGALEEGRSDHQERTHLAAGARQGEIPVEATGAAAAEALRRAPLQDQRREYLIFSGEDWKRDVTTMDPQGNVGSHILVGMKKKVGRAFQEQGHGDAAATTAGIGVEPATEPADHLLFHRGHTLLSPLSGAVRPKRPARSPSTARSRAARRLRSSRTTPRYAVEKFSVVENLVTPVGDTVRTQDVTAAYAVENGVLTLKSIDVADFAGKPIHRGMNVTYKVEGRN